MIIGVPKEIKNNENRVGMTPAGVAELVKKGHTVYVQATAGANSGFSDDDYIAVGAKTLLTIDASGIGLACLCAVPFGVPVVFAKKSRSSNIAGEVYTSQVFSFTHGTEHRIMIPRQFLTSADRVLLIDDFLASGEALRGLDDLCRQAGACVVGAGVFVEKVYQGGGNRLREAGMRIESLARITAMSPEAGVTFG